MNRKALATLVLAGLVIVGTSGASGGCGGSGGDDRGVSAPHVGDGGEQSAPKEEHSSEESPNPSHDAQPHNSKSLNTPEEPPNKGTDPCNAHLSPITVGSKVKTTLTVGPCNGKPKQYSGSLMLQYGTGELPTVKWTTATLIPIYDQESTQEITATCKDAYWVAVYEAAGRDANGKDFQSTHSVYLAENDFPRKADCP